VRVSYPQLVEKLGPHLARTVLTTEQLERLEEIEDA
jgi:hypothetical protein